MKKELQDMKLEDLQVLFITDTKIFIEALDKGTPLDVLQPMRERIKQIGDVIETRLKKVSKG
jgi:hypothetical protein